MNITITDLVKVKYPSLNHPQLLELLESKASFKTFKAGEILIEPGNTIRGIPLVTSGLIRIVKLDKHGNEVFLYFLEGGQTCATSLTCCTASSPSSIKAIVEEETECIWIPNDLQEVLTSNFIQWRNFMAITYQNRFEELFQVVEELAFNKLDTRLENYLYQLAEKRMVRKLQITHQQIAKDLNTSREVVSRLLKAMEQKGKLQLSRNNIHLK